MKIFASVLLSLFFFLQTNNGFSQKYWIFFNEKDIHGTNPSLSGDAIENRLRQNIPIDERDYPVNALYIKQIAEKGVHVEQCSRWLNAASATLSPLQIQAISVLPFIKNIQPVHAMITTQDAEIQIDSVTANRYDWQLKMLGLDIVHNMGFRGQGVKIAVFDNGFRKTNENRGFTHVFQENRMKYAYDFVDNDNDVFADCGPDGYCKHGSWCWSIIAGIIPDSMEGTAPEADFYLFRTENDASETHQEEDNWVAAAEVADSLGVQVFSTSLGYFSLDTLPYTYADLDGNTAIITKAADIAASKGIIVVNSAGNEGNNPWRVMIAPADGDSVIAVGAVDPYLNRATFSSQGNTVDGRIKPDVMALGRSTYLIELGGDIARGNGTSFSCPVMSGMMACIRQARPNIPAGELRNLLLQSASQYTHPDSLFGYGIPNAAKMLAESFVSTTDFLIFPNYPNTNDAVTVYINSSANFNGLIEFFDEQGKKVMEKTQLVENKSLTLIDIPFEPGLYFVRLYNKDNNSVEGVQKIVVH